MKKILIIAAVVALTAVAGAQFPQNALKKLNYAEQAIARLYVDTVNEDALVEDAIRGMLEKLDPHSSYSNAKETAELNEPLEGNFSGIGISYNIITDTVYVISTVAAGPSEKAGLLPGDRIIAVNDTVIAGTKLTQNEVKKRLRGPKGSVVELKVLRQEAQRPDTVLFRVTRDDIPIYSVDAAYMVGPETGFISLNKFGAETAREFREALAKLKKQGMKNLVLDLTNNGGGYLNAAVEVLSELLPPSTLAVYTEGLNQPRQNLGTKPAGSEPLFADGRLVVMADQFSASAAEITAGAVQDWDRGLVVGRRTYGKGLVQRPIPFPDGSMMRLTTAHYYTPSGRDIQKPFQKGDAEAYRKDISERFTHGELMHADSVKYDTTKLTHTLRLRRPIYGGGGISPDRFVPLDTMENTKWLRDLSAKGVINQYVLSYVDTRRKDIKKQYKDDDRFAAQFQVTPAMLADLRARAEKEGVKFNQEEYDRSEAVLRLIIKGLIGRDVFEAQTYDKVYNPHDPVYREALRLIDSPEYDDLLR